ncbi:MAG TPA: APC family permease [Jatrophihabitans sp.]
MNESINGEQRRRRLPLWATVALSLATVGPTLAMAGNGQGLIGTVGKGIPLVFVLGLIGVGLVAYGFIRLTRHMNHAGSAYALVGATLGPRAGFFSGFAMLGAYLGFAIGTVALFSAFTNAFLLQVQNGRSNAFQLPWIIPALVAVAASGLLAGRDTRLIARILIIIEGVGIVAMIILVAVIFAKGGAKSTGVDFSVFSFSGGVGVSAVMSGIVAAFLSWAGFEACAALGEETDNPRRNIPRALTGTLALTGVLFVVVMFAQTIGFGTDKAGLTAFQTSGNTLGDLGKTYIGTGFSLIIVFTAIISAFACHMASASTASRLIFAFARDGFGPRRLATVDSRTHAPREALWLVIGLALVVNVISWGTGWPRLGTGNAAIDSYFLFAVAGAVTLMVAYFMVEAAAIKFVTARGFSERTGESGIGLGVALPGVGLVVIAVVLYYNLKGQTSVFSSPPYVGVAWAVVGLLVALFGARLTRRIGQSLTAELESTRSDVMAELDSPRPAAELATEAKPGEVV